MMSLQPQSENQHGKGDRRSTVNYNEMCLSQQTKKVMRSVVRANWLKIHTEAVRLVWSENERRVQY